MPRMKVLVEADFRVHSLIFGEGEKVLSGDIDPD